MAAHLARGVLFLLVIAFPPFLLSSTLALGLEGHIVQPTFDPVDSLVSLSFVPGIPPSNQGIPGRLTPKPYALLGLGSYSDRNRWSFGGRGEGRLFLFSGTAKGLAVRKTDFGPASENDFSLMGKASFRPTGQAGIETHYRGIEANDTLGRVRRTENVFALSIREADRRGTINVEGSWAEISLGETQRGHLRAFTLKGETERLIGASVPEGRIHSSWMVSEEQSLGGSFYPQRLWGEGFLAAGMGLWNRMFLELGGRAEGYSLLNRNDAFIYPYVGLTASHPKGYSGSFSFEPELQLTSFEERYLNDPYMMVNPDARYSRTPFRFNQAIGYSSSLHSIGLRATQEHLTDLWISQDTVPGFIALMFYDETWKYSFETQASTALGPYFKESLEARGSRSEREIPYETNVSAANVFTICREGDSLTMRIDYVGERHRKGRNSLKSYFLSSVSFEKQIYPGITVYLTAENLGDNRYEIITGRFNQGRTLTFSMTWRA